MTVLDNQHVCIFKKHLFWWLFANIQWGNRSTERLGETQEESLRGYCRNSDNGGLGVEEGGSGGHGAQWSGADLF